MGQFVIACYRPRKNKQAALLEAVKDHLVVLAEQGLVTDRAPYVMRAQDGTIVEVFEWKSPAAIEQAHENPAVLALWERFEDACEYESIGNLEEAQQLFSPFEPIDS